MDLDVLRYVVEMLCVCSHGDDDLPVRLSQDMDTVAVEFSVLVNRSHRDVHGLLRSFLKRLLDGPDGRPDEMIAVGKSV